MPISKDLFLAILSMDAYNRGYGAGISDGGAGDPDGLGVTNIQTTYNIGNAEIINDSSVLLDSNGDPVAQAASFYAIAYEITDGTGITGLATGDTVIAYRGTRPEPAHAR